MMTKNHAFITGENQMNNNKNESGYEIPKMDLSEIEELEEYSTEIKLKDWNGHNPYRKI